MKNKLTYNLGLKMLSVFIAFALWLIVVNYDDPTISNTYTGIQVEIINQDALTDQGKVYEILNNTDIINVTITGPRSVIDSLRKENIRAIADMQELTLMDTVGIQLSTDKNFDQLDSMKGDHIAVELNIENLRSSHFPINLVQNGQPAEGYIVGDISSNQNTVRVSGAESVVSSVVRAECAVNVNGRSSDITTSSEIRLYDSDNQLVEHPSLQLNINSVNINAEILLTKEVPVVYQYSGIPLDGFVVQEPLTADYETVVIAGKTNVLEGISSIEVPATAINVMDKDESYIESVDLSRCLPEGVRFADPAFDGMSAVNVNLIKLIMRSLNIPVSNLSVTNLPEGYQAEVLLGDGEGTQNATLHIITEGVTEAYEGINGAGVHGTMDIASYFDQEGGQELTPGTYRMEIVFDLPEYIRTTTTYYADVKITEESD